MLKKLHPSLFGLAGLAGLAFALLHWTAHAVPLFIASPPDGGEFEDALTITFTQPMQETIALEFTGVDDAEFGCEWLVFFPGQPLQILECEVASGQLPSGGTVTWTINPGGGGMTTVGGQVLPESSGTFTTASLTDIEISVSPTDGAVYDPEVDGPVIFTFNTAMDRSAPASGLVAFDKGQWNIIWAGGTSIQCTISGEPEPGQYTYTVAGLVSSEGAAAPVFTGSFTIEEDPTGGGGDVEIFTQPSDGETLTSTPGLPTQVIVIFSEPMDASVDLNGAISMSQGDWNFTWFQILPGLPVNQLTMTPAGVLTGGTYEYTLSGLRTAAGGVVPDYSGSFIVDGPGTGGGGEITGGIPAPLCEDGGGSMLSFPKSLYVCGPDLFSWNDGSLAPALGDGFNLSASATVTGGSLASFVLLDGQGNQAGGVMSSDIGVRFEGLPDQGRVLATQGGTLVQPDVSFGLFDVSNGAVETVFQHRFAASGDHSTASFLPDGRVLLLRDSNEEIEATVLRADGTVEWAKRYSSASFGVDSTLGTASQSAHMSLLEDGGFLLSVSKRETEIVADGGNATVTRTAAAIVARLNSVGGVQWSRVYGFNEELDSLNAAGPFQDGSIILAGSVSGGSDFSSSSTAFFTARLDANGNPAWQKRIDGAFLSPMGVTSEGKVLFGGGSGGGLQFDALFLLMGLSGNIENQALVNAADVDVGFAAVADDKIFFSILASDVPSIDPNNPQTGAEASQAAIVGSSSLSLGGFAWKQYSKPVSSGFLGVDPESSDLVFSAFHEDTRRLDLVPLTGNLTASADCELFSAASVSVQSANLVAQNTVLNSSNAGVIASDFSPSFQQADITLEPFAPAEIDVCDEGGAIGGDCDAAVALRVDASEETGKATIEFTTALGCSHILQRAFSLANPPIWIPVETVNGDGSAYSREIDLSTTAEFYRVVSGGL